MKETNIFTEKKKLVGGIVPQPVAHTLSLLCLLTGETRSKVLARLIQAETKKYNNGEIIHTLAARIAKRAEGMTILKRNALFDKVALELKKKKIYPDHINIILSEARKIYAENKKSNQ